MLTSGYKALAITASLHEVAAFSLFDGLLWGLTLNPSPRRFIILGINSRPLILGQSVSDPIDTERSITPSITSIAKEKTSGPPSAITIRRQDAHLLFSLMMLLLHDKRTL